MVKIISMWPFSCSVKIPSNSKPLRCDRIQTSPNRPIEILAMRLPEMTKPKQNRSTQTPFSRRINNITRALTRTYRPWLIQARRREWVSDHQDPSRVEETSELIWATFLLFLRVLRGFVLHWTICRAFSRVRGWIQNNAPKSKVENQLFLNGWPFVPILRHNLAIIWPTSVSDGILRMFYFQFLATADLNLKEALFSFLSHAA